MIDQARRTPLHRLPERHDTYGAARFRAHLDRLIAVDRSSENAHNARCFCRDSTRADLNGSLHRSRGDDPKLWNYKPLVRLGTPGEELWRFRRDHVFWTCELRYHGKYGTEAQILRDGELSIARTYPSKELAVAWAEAGRQRREIG